MMKFFMDVGLLDHMVRVCLKKNLQSGQALSSTIPSLLHAGLGPNACSLLVTSFSFRYHFPYKCKTEMKGQEQDLLIMHLFFGKEENSL